MKRLLILLPLFYATTLLAGGGGVGEGNTSTKKTMPDGEESTAVHDVFKDTRLINGHSTEMLMAHKLDVRISHRFGDIAGTNGGSATLWGTDQAADIRIGFEYGINDNINIGLARNKGAGPLSQIIEGYAKARIMQQDDSHPVSIVVLATSGTSIQTASTDLTAPSSFQETAHRFSYVSQLLISRKFGERLSMQVMPSYVHRNYVAFGDQNSFLSVGVGGHLQLTKVTGIMAEYYHNLDDTDRNIRGVGFENPLSFGVTFDTGGHVFSLVLTNSRGLNETQFLPSTQTSWADGQYRYGFTISRQFTL